MDDARLVIQNLNKAYAAPVLTDVNLAVQKGEIHALVGENGAGKTTLVNILAGLTETNSGVIRLNGRAYAPEKPTDAFAAGVSFAAQELSIIDTLNVAENVQLRRLPRRRGVVDRRKLDHQARDMLALVGLDNVAPARQAAALSLAQRQLLEIAKALAGNPTLLLLDEPTAALNAGQAARVHGILRERANDGASIIYISHRLNDVLDIADTVSVLRDGQVVATRPPSAYSVDKLVSLMAGEALEHTTRAAGQKGDVRIRAEGVTTARLPWPINLSAHDGEITGLAGLAGAGRSELLHALFGLDARTGGTVTKRCADSDVAIIHAADAVKSGIALVGEDRQSMGLFEGQSVRVNMMLPGT
ncbi:MAG: sugar ABC transporter ATP-binding protein, partial [Pseudomonadota bacterium]